MNRVKITISRAFLSTAISLAIALVSAQPSALHAQDSATNAPSSPADLAWKALTKLNQAPTPPADWQTNKPTQAEVAAFYTPKLLKIADAARDFYTKYPKDKNAEKAREIELSRLNIAERNFGDTNDSARIDALIALAAKNPKATEQEKINVRTRQLQKLMQKLPESLPEVEKIGHDLVRDFPTNVTGYQVLYAAMRNSEGDEAAKLAKELTGENVPEQIRAAAKAANAQAELLNKPLDLKYTSVDGREVDIASLKGKVVLVDFWATWCGPCMGELPNVKAAYAELHPKGFEIVGISFDEDKDKLLSTLKSKEMTWPQYFDGAGWGNKYGKQWGIQSIPTMWLVNKKGVLCDVNGRENLKEKVTKLLNESI